MRGILTERDIVFRVVAQGLDPAATSVESIMTTQVQTIHKNKPFGHALHLMYEGGFRHMPVVDDGGTPVGLLAAHDALDIDGLQLEHDLVRREEISVIL
ncbi:putative inosine-5-monophosphate dehydrogenase related protein [Azoarcus sp. CIB]|nr:putative inosine-5-monophosphate dehydrogenase related protein [Azoarcus sp. CIB]